MNLEQLANLAEFISAIAVLVTLIYLAVEIRQNTTAVKGSTLAGNTEIWTSLLLQVADSENLGSYVSGSTGNADIKPKEFTQFLFYCRVIFVSFENQFYQYTNGTLDSEIYQGYERSLSHELLVYRGFRMYWSLYRHVFSPAFVERVDRLIESLPEVSPARALTDWKQLAQKLQQQ